MNGSKDAIVLVMAPASDHDAFNPDKGVPPTRLLVVDDDLASGSVLVDQLRLAGHDADCAESVEEASALLDSRGYDVAFVSMVPLGVAETSFLDTLRVKTPRTKVIVITAHPEARDAVACLQAGAVDYLQKPVGLENLPPVIDRALRVHQQAARLRTLEACQAIFNAGVPEKLAEIIGHAAMQALDADDASLMLVEESNSLRLVWSHGLGGTTRVGTRIAFGERIAGKVALQRRPMVVNDLLREDPRFDGVTPPERKIQSSIVFPVTAGSRLVGVLNISRIERAGSFNPADLEEAHILAAQAGMALENARLVGELNTRVDELSRAQACIVQSDRFATVGQLASGVAHEINNPVAYVMANLDFVLTQLTALKSLRRDIPEADARDALWVWWQTISGQGDFVEIDRALVEARQGACQIRDIVSDMRTIARTDTGQEELFDLNRAIRSAERLATASIRGVAELKLDLASDTWVVGNVGQLSQVFLSLLVNAAQAIPPGRGTTAKIVVTTRREGNRIVASVTDTGVGIPAEVQARVFSPFFTTRSDSRGTGLGLSISRDTIKRHGGEISFRSEVGVGTTFTMSLPLAKGAQSEGEAAVPAPIPSVEKANEGRHRVLFVDDEENLRKSYQRYFGDRYDVVLAPDGGQALEILADGGNFDLVVCDLVMPGMSGMELFRLACERFPAVQSRFVFVTGGVGQIEVQQFLATVKNPTFEKPFRFEEIDELLARHKP